VTSQIGIVTSVGIPLYNLFFNNEVALTQQVVMLRVGVTIKQIENKPLQNLIFFRVSIIWGGAQKKLEGTAPECPPVATDLGVGIRLQGQSKNHRKLPQNIVHL